MSDRKFGDTRHGVWLGELINNCLRELPGGRSSVDMNLLIHMCKDEPKNAQVSMQILAHDLQEKLGDDKVSQATEIGQTFRLLLGSLCAAYCVSREVYDGVPPELEQIIKWNPLIIECANFVSRDQKAIKTPAAYPGKPKKS